MNLGEKEIPLTPTLSPRLIMHIISNLIFSHFVSEFAVL